MGLLAKIGKAGKGLATIIGGVVTATGLGLGGGDELVKCATELAKSPDGMIAAAGALLTLLGIARKAGWVGAAAKSEGR